MTNLSAQLNDIITDGTAKFQVVKTSTSKDLADHDSDVSAHASGVPLAQIANSARTLGNYTLEDILALVETGGSGMALNQVTKTNVTASSSSPKTVSITIPETRTFAKIPVEILKFESGTESTITEYTFDNGDASDFTFNANYVAFDGYMHPKTINSSVTMSTPNSLGSGYMSQSDDIDMSVYKNVTINVVTQGEAVVTGIAHLTTSGSAANTDWKTYLGEA